METLTLRTRTYSCTICDYKADAQAYENRAYFEQAFPAPSYETCPSCLTGRMALETNEQNMTEHTILGDQAIDEKLIVERDQHGEVVMEESEQTIPSVVLVEGRPEVIETPMLKPKMIEQSESEKADLREQRDRDLSELEKLAV